jgi:hypothetical protein
VNKRLKQLFKVALRQFQFKLLRLEGASGNSRAAGR